MRLFNKKKRVVDWTESLQKQQEQTESMRSEMAPTSNGTSYSNTNSETAPFPFFAGNTANSYPTATSTETSNDSSLEERRRKLGKRLLDMTSKIEDLSNQIYKLQQRIEVLERKSGY